MRYRTLSLLFILNFFFTTTAQATLNIFATVPEWAALAKAIGGDKVKIYQATHALQDPHRIDARPSLIVQARNADLILATGADLEANWLPLVIRESGNARIQPGKIGYFEAAQYVTLLEIPPVLDRIHGDIHAAGNPHIQTNPQHILTIGDGMAERMAKLDPNAASDYQQRWQAFAKQWRTAITRWEKMAQPLKNTPVLVQHSAFTYLNRWLQLKEVGILEPKPGIEPSSNDLKTLLAQQQKQPARMILHPAYQGDGPALWMAERAHIPVVTLPFTVGGNSAAQDLFSLFEDTIQRLLQANIKQ